MRKLKKLNLKEKMKTFGLCMFYPFMLLYDFLRKSAKALSARKRQITASVLSGAIMLTMIPMGTFSAYAEGTTHTVTIDAGYNVDAESYNLVSFEGSQERRKTFTVADGAKLPEGIEIISEDQQVMQFDVADIKQVSASGRHSVILIEDGSVWACGDNTFNALGNDSIELYGSTTTFVPMMESAGVPITNVKKVAVGYGHTVVLKNDGTVWTNGSNGAGQLGNGEINNTEEATGSIYFVQAKDKDNKFIKDAVDVEAGGSSSYVIRTGGALWAVGANEYGQLGVDKIGAQTLYTACVDDTGAQIMNVTAVSASQGNSHVMALKSDGTVWVCGDGSIDRLGTTVSGSQHAFIQLMKRAGEPFTGVKKIAAGGEHSVVLERDGTVWSCGRNSDGRLGNGSTYQPIDGFVQAQKEDKTKDAIKPEPLYADDISAGESHIVALKNGTIWDSCTVPGNVNYPAGSKYFTEAYDYLNQKSLAHVVQIEAGSGFTFALQDRNGERTKLLYCGSTSMGVFGSGQKSETAKVYKPSLGAGGVKSLSDITVTKDMTIAPFYTKVPSIELAVLPDGENVTLQINNIKNINMSKSLPISLYVYDGDQKINITTSWGLTTDTWGAVGNATNPNNFFTNVTVKKVTSTRHEYKVKIADTYNIRIPVESNVVVYDLTAEQSPLTINSSTTHSGSGTYTATTTGGSSGEAVTYKIVDGGTGAGSFDGNVLTITKLGTIKFTATMAGNKNYKPVTSKPFTLTATRADSAITINPKTVTYNKQPVTYDASDIATQTGSGEVIFEYYSDATCNNVIDAPINAGTYYVKATVAASDFDYAATSEAVPLVIQPKPISISGVTVNDKVYDGKNLATLKSTGRLEGVESGDSVAINAGSCVFNDVNVGEQVDVTASDFWISGISADNYTLSAQPTVSTAAINPAELRVSVEKISINAGQSIPPLNVLVEGFVNGESESSLTGFAKPTASVDGSYDTNNTEITQINVKYNGGTPTNNYTFSYNNKAEIEIRGVDVTEEDYTISSDINNWQKDNVTITPTNGYTLISVDNKVTWTSSHTISTEGKGNVTFYLKKQDGMVTNGKTVSYQLDKTAPTNLIVSYEKNGWKEFLNHATFGLFFKDTLNVKLTATDSLSGVKEFKYTLDGGVETIAATNASASFSIEPQYKGNISAITAIDSVGNQSEVKATEYFVVDNQKPAVPTVDLNGYEAGIWTNKDVKFTVSGATAISGIAKYQYSTNGGSTWNDMTTIEKSDATEDTPYNALKAELLISADCNGESYIFRAVSNVANEGTASSATVVKIDKFVPTISVSGDTNNHITSDNVAIDATYGISGIVKMEVQKDNGSWINITNSDQNSYTVTDNGTYTFRMTNGLGVTAIDSITYNKIDSAKPVIAIDSYGYTDGSWCNTDNITLSVTNSNIANLGTTKIEYKVGNGEWQDYTSDIVISTECEATIYTFKATSAAGVASDVKIFTVKRDTVLPEGDITFNDNAVKQFINNISFGLFFKETVDVNITGTDATSGVKNIEYYKSDKVLDQAGVDSITDWTKGESFSLTPTDKEKFIVYVRIIDNADHSITFGSNGATFDTTAPLIIGITNDATYYTTQKVVLADDNLESVTLNGSDVIDFSNGILLEGNKEQIYSILVTDKAENQTTFTVTMKPIASLSSSIDSLTSDTVKSSDEANVQTVKLNLEAVDIANATQAEKNALTATISICETLLQKIADIGDEMIRVTNAVNSYRLDSVKSSDKEGIHQLKEDIEVLTTSENLTFDETLSLYEVEDTADNLLQKLADANTAANPQSYDEIKDINSDNVKLSDKDALDKAKADIKQALTDFSGNYTKDEINDLRDKLELINGALTAIENVQNVIDSIQILPNPKNVAVTDAEAIRLAKKAYDMLTDHEKTLVQDILLDKLNKVCTSLTNLFLNDDLTGTSIEAVGDTIFDPNTAILVVPINPNDSQKKNVQAVVNESEIISLYDISLLLSGVKIQPSGKVKITLTLTQEQLESFESLQIVYIDDNNKVTIIPSTMIGGKISFEVDHFSNYGIIGTPVKDNTGSAPLTSDNSNIFLCFALLFVSGGVAVALVVKRRKKYK